MSPMSISNYCRTTSELHPEWLQQVALRADTKFWRGPTWDHCCHGWITSTAEKPVSTHPIILQVLTSWITSLSERRKKKWDSSSVTCSCELVPNLWLGCTATSWCPYIPSQGTPARPTTLAGEQKVHQPKWQSPKWDRQLSTSLSLLEMHRDMT